LCYSGDYDWLDIGRIDDYETAVELFETNRDAYLPISDVKSVGNCHESGTVAK
jgi:hypothetical protein